jgi:hypothetical protein
MQQLSFCYNDDVHVAIASDASVYAVVVVSFLSLMLAGLPVRW